jgi:hypothetical protein
MRINVEVSHENQRRVALLIASVQTGEVRGEQLREPMQKQQFAEILGVEPKTIWS